MLDAETKRRIDSCRDILVGKVPDPKSQVEQITIALIYKFMDDMDREAEDLGGKRSFFAGDFAHYGWARLKAPELSGKEKLDLYAEAIGKMNENPGIPALFRDIFKNAYLPYRDPETLRAFLKEIDGFTYDHSERLGDAFEYLLSVLGSQGDAGQFRTPRHIIDFMVEVIDPQKHESILDPACGTAGFLISAWKHILRHNTSPRPQGEGPGGRVGDQLTPDERQNLAANIRGYDISPDMVRLSLVNLYLHGFTDPHIVEYDTLTSEERWNETADVILANPPFMSPKGGIKPHKRFSVQATRSEVLFVDYMAEHLSPNGRAAIVVPEGIIFQSGTAYKKLREMLVKNSLIAVVSLPAGVFNPYSGVKTSILILDRRRAKTCDSVLFVKVENDGFGLGAQRRAVTGSGLPEAKRLLDVFFAAPEEFENGTAAHKVTRARIGENGEWNLSGERYKEARSKVSDFLLVELNQVALIKKGSPITKKDTTQGKYPVIAGGQQPAYFHSAYNRIGKTITVSASGAYAGFVNYFNEPIFASDCTTIQPINEEQLIPDFLFRVLKTKQDEIYAMQVGGGQPHVYPKDLQSIHIPLPPLETQQEIIAEIEGYQKIIDGARQVVENYRPRIDVQSNWANLPLGKIATLRTGTTPDTSRADYYIGDVKFVKTSEIDNCILNCSTAHISTQAVSDYGLTIFPKGTVLMAMYGQGKTRGQVAYLNVPACTTQNAAAITPSESIDPMYLYLYLLGQYMQLRKHGIEGHISHLNLAYLKTFEVPVPPLEIQRAIVAEIEAEQALVDASKQLIARFEAKIKATIGRVWGGAE